jgi:hypothetical protein
MHINSIITKNKLIKVENDIVMTGVTCSCESSHASESAENCFFAPFMTLVKQYILI